MCMSNVMLQHIPGHLQYSPVKITEQCCKLYDTHTVSVLHITGAVRLYNLCSKNTSVVLQNSKLQSRCKQKHTNLLNMSITAAQFQTKLECDDSCLLRYDTGLLDELVLPGILK
jgi:hypothetical protein